MRYLTDPHAAARARARSPGKILWALLLVVLGCIITPAAAKAQGTAPTITISPTHGSTLTSSAQTITITLCDADDALVDTHEFYFNNVSVSYTWTALSAISGCVSRAQVTFSVTLLPGDNGIAAFVEDAAHHRTYGGASYDYDYPTGHTPSVTPADSSVTVIAGKTAFLDFKIANVGSSSYAFYTVTVTCGSFSGCAHAPTNANASTWGPPATVTAQFAAPSTLGDTGTIRLVATYSGANGSIADTGFIHVTTVAPSVAVNAQRLRAGPTIVRSQCLTIAAGDDAASECGDLRVVHDLPATRTYNAVRTPALLYNSAHAAPAVVLPLDISTFGTTGASSIDVTVTLNGQAVTRNFSWGGTYDGIARQVSFVASAGAFGVTQSGMYPASITVLVHDSSATAPTRTIVDTVSIVDRRTSPFGRGWWLDGVEQLLSVDANTKLWIGGDGSTRVFARSTDSLYVATPTLDRTEQLKRTTVGGNQVWRRMLRNGAFVEFDSNLRHIRTVSTLGHETKLAWNSDGSLDSLKLATPATTMPAYHFTYASVSGAPRLSSVTSPQAGSQSRTISVTATGYRIDRLTGPDTSFVRFNYDTSGKLTARINRLGDSTSYAFDGAGFVSSYTNSMRSDAAVTTTLAHAASRGVTGAPPLISASRTVVDGPRTDGDTVAFFLTQFGAPAEVFATDTGSTTIERNDSRFPILATAIVQPNGLRTESFYSARGLPDSVRTIAPFGGANAVTRFTWHSVWDVVTRSSGPDSAPRVFTYDTGKPLRLSERWEGDTASHITYGYDATTSQLVSLRAPGATAPDSVVYDSTGNFYHGISPLGFVTEAVTDAIGRNTLLRAQVDTGFTRRNLRYDARGLVTSDTSFGGAKLHSDLALSSGVVLDSAQFLAVTNAYDAEGNLTNVYRAGSGTGVEAMTASTSYDARHRKVTESIDGQKDWTYDVSGNLAREVTLARDTIVMTYDARGRMLTRIVPSKSVASGTACTSFDDATTCANRHYRFPYYGSSTSTVTFAADTNRFAYDRMGNVLSANDWAAKVKRAYWITGAIKADSSFIRVYSDSGLSTDPYAVHVFGTNLEYDLAGRRTKLVHDVGTLGSGTEQDYAYSPITGAMTGITDHAGVAYAFFEDARGRLVKRTTSADSSAERFVYDADDRLYFRVDSSSKGVLHTDTLHMDGLGRVTKSATTSRITGLARSEELSYSGLGALAQSYSYTTNAGTNPVREQYQTDAFGNIIKRIVGDGASQRAYLAYEYTGEELEHIGFDSLSQGQTFDEVRNRFDNAGNVAWASTQTMQRQSGGPGAAPVDFTDYKARSYYDGDNKLRVYDRQNRAVSNGARGTRSVFEEYRYDALGRRVMTRSRRDSTCTEGTSSSCGNLDFAIWDGSQLLYEIRERGGNARSAAAMRSFSSSIDSYGGKIAYVHGGGIDQPLGVYKGAFAFAPHASWKGQFDFMTKFRTAGDTTYTEFSVQGRDVNPYLELRTWGEDSTFLGSLVRGKRDESGLVYMRNRYYDPKSGRFTQQDPIGLAGGMNLYGFASGDPVTYSDPFGLFPCCDLNAVANVAAGFGDAVSFGITDWMRDQSGDNAVINHHSTAYIGGEAAEFVAEVALTAGAAALERAAGEVSSRAARAAARPMVEGVEREAGQVVHHINPLAGHPGGAKSVFPLRGLPASIHSGTWNLKALDAAAHGAAHANLRHMEAGVRALWDQSAIVLRGMLDVGRSSP
ncbi:MAG: hypothetical protein JWO05_1553 [Gemmatimonadetes bacterium]|nr:hypothetical protein [Gemmatimonadota bacterium]